MSPTLLLLNPLRFFDNVVLFYLKIYILQFNLFLFFHHNLYAYNIFPALWDSLFGLSELCMPLLVLLLFRLLSSFGITYLWLSILSNVDFVLLSQFWPWDLLLYLSCMLQYMLTRVSLASICVLLNPVCINYVSLLTCVRYFSVFKHQMRHWSAMCSYLRLSISPSPTLDNSCTSLYNLCMLITE